MKKIFTLLAAALLALGAQAGNFRLLFGDTPVENGAAYNRGYELTETTQLGPFTVYNYVQDANLAIDGEHGVSYTVEVTVTNREPNLMVCSLDNMCITLTAGNNFTVKKVGTLGAEVAFPYNLEIDAKTDVMDHEGTEADFHKYDVLVKVYETAAPAGAISCTVTLWNKPQSEFGGNEGIEANTQYVRTIPGKQLTYNINEPTQLQVYGILGNLMLQKTISGHGTISLSSLPKGVYIYRCGKLHGKIVVS